MENLGQVKNIITQTIEFKLCQIAREKFKNSGTCSLETRIN